MSESPHVHNSCLICEAKQFKKLSGFEKAHLVKCKNCGFVFSERIPTLEELEEHYKGYGRNDYLSPITVKRYNELLDRFEPARRSGKMIDVGCGIGYFLEEAKKRKWEVYGTEFTEEAVDICNKKGIHMQKGTLNPKHYETGSFDVITSFEVIEHINNPLEELSQFHQLLRKGGLLYITTPNFNSLLRYHLKAEYNMIVYPEHISYYTPKTLDFVLQKMGFEKIKMEATGVSLTRFKKSKKISDEKLISKTSSDEKLRQSFENNSGMNAIKSLANWGLTTTGKGDALKALYRKK